MDADLDPRWAKMRDKTARQDFVIGVTSTKIYCRPGCPARSALPKNVLFFETTAQARAAGLRACKRCVPDT